MSSPVIPRCALDLRDPDFIRSPYPRLAELREHTPVFYEPRTEKIFLTRYEHIAAVLRDRTFGNAITHVLSRDELGWPPPDPRQADFDRFESNHILSNEPPVHTRLRSLVGKAFTPRRIDALRERVAAIIDRTLDELGERSMFDLVHDFAEPLPVIVICELLGVDAQHRTALRDWSAAIVKLYELDHTVEQQRAANDAVVAFSAFVRSIVAQRRVEPRDDLITALVQVEEAGDSLSEDELVSMCILLLNAGHEATVNGTSNAVVALLQRRDDWYALGAAAATETSAFVRTAIEELLRYDTPLPMFERWALADAEIDGFAVPQGAKVVLLYGSANRDPRKFASSDELDLHREPNQHLTFGLGIHFCLGAPLARLELQLALPALAQRFPELRRAEPDAPIAFGAGFTIRGVTRLDVVPGSAR